MNQWCKKYQPELMGSFICLFFGMLSGYIAHAGDTSWYQSLIKPTFNPPSWIFSPVWTILYLMIGTAGVKLWKLRKTYPTNFNLFFIQIILNYAWSSVFFYFKNIKFALIILAAMWCINCILLLQLKKQKNIALIKLFIPYFAWISFALILNFQIAQLNPHL